MAKKIVLLYPWEYAHDDCWWCGHDGADGATYSKPGEMKVCSDCADLLEEGAELAKVVAGPGAAAVQAAGK